MTNFFDAAVLEFLRHGRSTLDLLDQAGSHGEIASRTEAFRGLAMLLLAKPELKPALKVCLEIAERDLLHRPDRLGFTLAAALRNGITYGRGAAAQVLETYPSDEKLGVLPFKLAYQLRFMTGELDAMGRLAKNYLLETDPGALGGSFALGCLAFAQEELGNYEQARVNAEVALGIDAKDAWSAHVISHVYEMSGQAEDGLEWSKRVRPHFAHCNNFRYHMEWHEGLFLIREERFSDALAHYDFHVCPEVTDDYRDFANASSYLARLSFRGVNVGDRWLSLQNLARKRSADQELVFAMLHRFLTFLCSGDLQGACAIRASAHELARTTSEQASVAQRVGVPLMDLLSNLNAGDGSSLAPVIEVASRTPELGGSNAQREVFLDSLIYLLGSKGALKEVAEVARIKERIAGPDLGS